MINSNLNEIPSAIIRDALAETIRKQVNSKQINIKISSAAQKGADNFMGIIYRIEFMAENETEHGSTFASKLILKVAPLNEASRDSDTRVAFLRESYMYNKVLPFFRQFERSKGLIDERDCFNEYPKCYGNVDVNFNECVFLEDLGLRSFSVSDRKMDANHVRLVMQALGKFHAISFAAKDQQPDKFNEIASKLDEIYVRAEDHHWREFFNEQSDKILNLLSNDEDTLLYTKVKKLFEHEALDIAVDCLKLELAGTASVITHGDAWQNNMMFRYDDNGKPVEISIIDWQISRHSSPIIDIVHFMFFSTTKELRDAYYEHFLHAYHDSLSAHIRRLGSDPGKLFPYQLMLDHFGKFGKFGLIITMAFLPMVMKADITTDPNIDGLRDDDTKNVQSTKQLNKLLRDIVTDMVQLKYI